MDKSYKEEKRVFEKHKQLLYEDEQIIQLFRRAVFIAPLSYVFQKLFFLAVRRPAGAFFLAKTLS